MKLSFVIISHLRPECLLRCLTSLSKSIQDIGLSRESAEVWVGFNGPNPHRGPLLKEISSRCPGVNILEMERTSRGGARNLVVGKTRGRIVFFLDDDTVVPVDFTRQILAKFEKYPQAMVIGGPNIRQPNSSPFQRAVDFLLRSPAGSGPMRIRYLRTGDDRFLPGWCFTLSNLGVRREVFERYEIFFPTRCVTAEENLFLFRVERSEGRTLYSPEIYVYHRRRKDLLSFCLQVFQSGRGRMQITRLSPSSIQPVVALPACFLIYLLCLPFLTGAAGFLLPLASYIAVCVLESLRLAILGKDPKAACRLMPLFFLSHLSYAVGLLSGIFSSDAPSLAIQQGLRSATVPHPQTYQKRAVDVVYRPGRLRGLRRRRRAVVKRPQISARSGERTNSLSREGVYR